MSPIDDELRAALRSRAAAVAPAPDPLTGIEQRARRLRRNRLAASVLFSTLAVAVVAAAVPVLQAVTSTSQQDAPFVPAAPTPAASPTPAGPPTPAPPPAGAASGLDPAQPWPYRGADLELLGPGTLDTIRSEYAVRQQVDAGEVTLTPLFGQVYEPSQQFELFFLAKVGQTHRWAVSATPTHSGPEFRWDEQLPAAALSLAAALPGDEGVSRLVVVASPEAVAFGYAAGGATEHVPMTVLEPGVAITPLEGDPAADSYRFRPAPGGPLIDRAAPDPPRAQETAAEPDNLLGWPARGSTDRALQERAAAAYAAAKAVPRTRVSYRALLTAGTDGGTRYTVLEAWVQGRRAQVFGLVETPGRPPQPVLQPLTEPAEPVVALLLTDQPGRTADELVVIPAPATGQVSYAPHASAEPEPVEPAPGLDGVVLLSRARGAESDRLVLLDGNGDLDRPTYDGPVAALLCGEAGCG